MSARLGPMHFRMPLDRDTRKAIASPVVQAGNALITWPREAIAITGIWPAVANPPMVRPVFPGSMRFLASDALQVPTPDQIVAVEGKVSDASIKRSLLTGTLVISVQAAQPLSEMKKFGTLEALAEAPTLAFYGPITLTEAFIRSALLDHKEGLLPGSFYVGIKRIDPGAEEWEALALQRFLAGEYEPVLRAGEALDDDDAARLPMPALLIEAGGALSLGFALAWPRKRGLRPSGPADTDLEIVPTLPFIRHVAKRLREPVLAADKVDAIVSALINDETDSAPWTKRLADKLQAIGFGVLKGEMPIGQVIREFQIAAAGTMCAVAKDATVPQDRLRERYFTDLKAQQNPVTYTGSVSGRANTATRQLLELWSDNGLRSPVLIIAYPGAAIDEVSQRPVPSAQPVFRDLWTRQETTDISLRMFAADFTVAEDGATIGIGDLEPIGHCARWKRTKAKKRLQGDAEDEADAQEETEEVFGPGTLAPSAATRLAYAEVAPERLTGFTAQDLLAPIPPDDPTKLAIRSTFKVIRAVSEFECLGYLDQINAYDDAGISFGPCHWAMAKAIDNPKGATELGGLAAYLRFLAHSLGKPELEVFERHGITAAKGTDPAATARASGKAAFLNQLYFLDDRGEPIPMDKVGPRDIVPSWRSYQRWIAIGRRHPTIGLAAWGQAVRRIQAIREVPIALKVLPLDKRPNVGSRPTIGTVFTSELAIAQIMRWHVKILSGVAVVREKDSASIASRWISAAYIESKPTDRADPAAWEVELLRTLREQLEKFVKKTGKAHDQLPQHFDQLAKPAWIGGSNPRAYGLDPQLRLLSSQAGSFKQAQLPKEMMP